MKFECCNCNYFSNKEFKKCPECGETNIIEINVKRQKLDKKVKDFSNDKSRMYDVYEQSIKVAENFALIGTVIFFISVVIAGIWFVTCLFNDRFQILASFIIIISGYSSKLVFDWMGLVLHNLAELNNKK